MNRFLSGMLFKINFRVLHKELLADPRVNPELTSPQMVRICVGPLLAYFAQLYIVSDNGEIKRKT